MLFLLKALFIVITEDDFASTNITFDLNCNSKLLIWNDCNTHIKVDDIVDFQ